MKPKTQSPKTLRQRKFLVALPILVLPFATLLFWALGGGKPDGNPQKETTSNGFNLRLPDAHLSDDASLDKMSYYDRAQSDSARLDQLTRNDPYYRPDTARGRKPGPSAAHHPVATQGGAASPPGRNEVHQDANEAKVYRKIEQLNTLLDKTASEPVVSRTNAPEPSVQDAPANADIGRLEQMMHSVSEPGEEDPEMRQINGMLEKILDIQHPERVTEKTRELSQQRQGQVLPVVSAAGDNPVGMIENEPLFQDSLRTHPVARATSGFYSLEETTQANDTPNAIEAVIHGTQTLTSGSTAKLRLTTEVYVNGIPIPKDHFLYGTASLEGERLRIEIKGIRYGNSLFPVRLSVYDTDGLGGIYVPGTLTRDAAKQSAGGLVQGVNLGTLDASLGAQAASAGIEAAKSLLGKRAKLVRVSVKAGYRVLLRDEKQKQNL